MTIDEAKTKCKFNDTEKCIKANLFNRWKGDKTETAYLMLGVCPSCPIYTGEKDFQGEQRNKRR